MTLFRLSYLNHPHANMEPICHNGRRTQRETMGLATLAMPKFSVTIEGHHYLPRVSESDPPSPVGFYAVRYTKADSAEQARTLVLQHFDDELDTKLNTTSLSRYRVTQVKAVESMEGNAVFEGGIIGMELMLYPEQPSLLNPIASIKHFVTKLFG